MGAKWFGSRWSSPLRHSPRLASPSVDEWVDLFALYRPEKKSRPSITRTGLPRYAIYLKCTGNSCRTDARTRTYTHTCARVRAGSCARPDSEI